MNLARTALVVSTAFALLLGGVPAALAAPTPPPEPPRLSGPPELSGPAGAPAPRLSGGSAGDVAPASPAEVPEAPAAGGLAAGGLAGAAAAGAHPTTVEDITEAFEIVNDHRSQARRAPLVYNTALSRNAQQWAETMAGARKESRNPDPWAGAPSGGVRMDQYYGKGVFTGAFEGVDAVEALAHYLLDFYPREGTDQFARDLTHLGIGVSHVATSGSDGPGWETYLTIYYYAYPAGQAVPGTFPTPAQGFVPPVTAPAHTVRGAIGTKYHRLGGAAVLGEPTMSERGGLVHGGVYQQFRKGTRTTTIYWAPGYGAMAVKNYGSIGRKWIGAGREHNFGLPATDERPATGGAYQVFRRDGRSTQVMWSPGTGSRAIKLYGAIGRAWKAAGRERGYGFPVTDEYRYGAEVRQRFSKGYTVHYAAGRTWATR
ncbi:CAP domain-containing protein [uncultured Kocuria sp.]|uniref:CAP domain-containing protein n=1 Tax=uncultured Kocuria sp. TaxID=259305 RepID=UPI002618B311|nr:CAP domain-containing protein [uncultured Kocuria sp.]